MAHIVVAGAGYAGMLAALRLRKTRAHQVTLVSASPNFVERIRLHQTAADGTRVESPLTRLIAGAPIGLVLGRIAELQPARREILLADGTALTYDRLIYALGSQTGTSAVPGVSAYAHRLNNPDSAARLYAALLERHAGRLLVVGGGLTGIEAAAEIAKRHAEWQVTLLSAGTLGADLSPRGQDYLRAALRRKGVSVIENQRAARLEADRAYCAGGAVESFDMCLWAGSFEVSKLAAQSGFAVDAAGRILVDAALRSISHPEVYVVGDAAASGLRMGCATALPMGAHAADSILADLDDEPVQPHRFGYTVRCISLGRDDGLIQLVDPLDQPRDRIITGRPGAVVKELVCQGTWYSLEIERRLPGAFTWNRAEVPSSLRPLPSLA